MPLLQQILDQYIFTEYNYHPKVNVRALVLASHLHYQYPEDINTSDQVSQIIMFYKIMINKWLDTQQTINALWNCEQLLFKTLQQKNDISSILNIQQAEILLQCINMIQDYSLASSGQYSPSFVIPRICYEKLSYIFTNDYEIFWRLSRIYKHEYLILKPHIENKQHEFQNRTDSISKEEKEEFNDQFQQYINIRNAYVKSLVKALDNCGGNHMPSLWELILEFESIGKDSVALQFALKALKVAENPNREYSIFKQQRRYQSPLANKLYDFQGKNISASDIEEIKLKCISLLMKDHSINVKNMRNHSVKYIQKEFSCSQNTALAFDMAKNLYDQSQNPNARITFILGSIYYRTCHFREALEFYRNAIFKNRKNLLYQHELKNLIFNVDQYKQYLPSSSVPQQLLEGYDAKRLWKQLAQKLNIPVDPPSIKENIQDGKRKLTKENIQQLQQSGII
eukprot:gb/GECH01009304.1/.p1 GENE.gb/GECH01009304.1/~~gb/GECH01009304.1/.p1  ORF type:complete len:454 (+),score=95.31 gb/GECH01009304.1/:1-1362(+)